MNYGELVYTEKDGPVIYRLYIAQDDCEVRGNASATGDAKNDRCVEDEILERLYDGNGGDVWAWFCAMCEAEVDGVKGRDALGGCSYYGLKDFIEPGGYWQDLKLEALRDLVRNCEVASKALDTLLEWQKNRATA